MMISLGKRFQCGGFFVRGSDSKNDLLKIWIVGELCSLSPKWTLCEQNRLPDSFSGCLKFEPCTILMDVFGITRVNFFQSNWDSHRAVGNTRFSPGCLR